MPATFVIDAETYHDPESFSDDDALCIAEMASRRDEPVAKFVATCPALARVVLVGLLHVETGGRMVVYDGSLVDVDDTSSLLTGVTLQPGGGEHGVLIAVHALLARASRLVGFGSRHFDLPLLLLRAMKHGVEPAQVVRRAVYQKPWESGCHVDVLSALTFGGATGKYPLAAYSIGLSNGGDIANPKAQGDGGGVAELVKARNGTRLSAYCLSDVASTAALAVKAGVLDLPAAQQGKAA